MAKEIEGRPLALSRKSLPSASSLVGLVTRGIQFPVDENRDGSLSAGLLTVQPGDAAASPRKFH